ncbi:ankyrin repeat [Sparganum proliferum]
MKKFLKRLSQPKNKAERSLEGYEESISAKSAVCYEVKEKDLPKLHKAVWQGDLEAVKRTPLHLACAKGNIDIVQCLLEYNAKVNLLDQNFQTPLMKAIQGGHFSCIGLLLNYRADLTVRDEGGNAPLHLAVKYGHRNIAELFLRAGVGINSHNSQGMTPLHLAVENQDVVMVNFLLSEGAEVDCITNAKKSALMISCEKGDAEIADLLINCGANCELRDCDEHTAEEIAKLNDHEECYQLLHSLRDSVGSVGHASSSQRPARSNLPSELRSSYREREVTPLPGLTTSAKSNKSELKVVDRKPWRLSDVLGEDTGDDVVDIETDFNSPATAENSDGDSSVAEPASRGNSGDQDQRTAVCSVENANESEGQTKSSEEDVDEGQGGSKTEEGVRPRLFRRKSTTENRVASPSALVVGGATVPPNAARRFVSSPSQSDPKNTTQSWESEPGGTQNRTMKSPEVHLTQIPVSMKKPEIDEEEDSWASEDTDNNEPTKPCETLIKAFAQKIASSSGEDKPSKEKGLEHGTDSESDTEDWDSNNSEEGRQPALMDTASAFARVRQQMKFSLGLDQSEDEEEDREVKDALVNPSPKIASKAAMERSDLNQSPWDSSASEMPPAKEDVQAPRSPVVRSIWLKSSSKSQQDEQIRITSPERKPGPATPEVDDRWDSSSTSDVDEIPMLGDEVTPVKEDGSSRAIAKVPSPTATKNDSLCVTGADKPVTRLMQAVDYEDGLDEEEDGPDGERPDSNEARAMSAQLSGSRTLPTALYRPRDYDSDEAGLGLSPIEEKTEDCFSFASNSSHSKKEENAHQSVCLSPGTSLTAEPIYVNAEWLKQVSEADSTGTGIANLPSESRSLKVTQTVVTDTDVKQNQTARFETQSTESAPVVRRSPLSPSSEHTLTQKNGKCSSRPSSVEMLRQMLHAWVFVLSMLFAIFQGVTSVPFVGTKFYPETAPGNERHETSMEDESQKTKA